jgi:hypothetical protein
MIKWLGYGSGHMPFKKYYPQGCAITQAVICWFLNMEAQVFYQGSLCGICGGQSSTGTGISLSFGFLINIIPTMSHIHSYIIWGMDSGPVRGRSSTETQSHSIVTTKEVLSIHLPGGTTGKP